jgi:hypothetical protein
VMLLVAALEDYATAVACSSPSLRSSLLCDIRVSVV